jgi:Predicted oxidoreductase
MRTITLGKSGLQVPAIAVGCFRIHELDQHGVERLLKTALDMGANFFDHADIYGGGSCEELFAGALDMNDDLREKLIIQSKCGIRQNLYDFSKKYILESTDGILKRLKTDYLDILLLHRPDALVEPGEVAEAFDILQQSGKVRHFGVSNHNPMQIQLLQKHIKQPLVANQLQLSVTHSAMITQGMYVNMEQENAVGRDGNVLDFCRLNDITIQPWSPFQYGFFEGTFLGSPKYPELNAVIDRLAEKYGISNTTIALAWILRHPAKMHPITGTTRPERLAECLKAAEITITREEWYEMLLASGHSLP